VAAVAVVKVVAVDTAVAAVAATAVVAVTATEVCTSADQETGPSGRFFCGAMTISISSNHQQRHSPAQHEI
jgi:hypothetical protein